MAIPEKYCITKNLQNAAWCGSSTRNGERLPGIESAIRFYTNLMHPDNSSYVPLVPICQDCIKIVIDGFAKCIEATNGTGY